MPNLLASFQLFFISVTLNNTFKVCWWYHLTNHCISQSIRNTLSCTCLCRTWLVTFIHINNCLFLLSTPSILLSHLHGIHWCRIKTILLFYAASKCTCWKMVRKFTSWQHSSLMNLSQLHGFWKDKLRHNNPVTQVHILAPVILRGMSFLAEAILPLCL